MGSTEVGIAGAALSGASAIAGGVMQKQQADYQAKVAERNALAERMKGAAEAERIAGKYDRIRGQQAAAAAASGVDPTAGSASLIINQATAKNEALDTMSALWNAESSADAFAAQAKGYKMAGSNAQTAGFIQGPTSFLQGLTSMRRRSGTELY